MDDHLANRAGPVPEGAGGMGGGDNADAAAGGRDEQQQQQQQQQAPNGNENDHPHHQAIPDDEDDQDNNAVDGDNGGGGGQQQQVGAAAANGGILEGGIVGNITNNDGTRVRISTECEMVSYQVLLFVKEAVLVQVERHSAYSNTQAPSLLFLLHRGILLTISLGHNSIHSTSLLKWQKVSPI